MQSTYAKPEANKRPESSEVIARRCKRFGFEALFIPNSSSCTPPARPTSLPLRVTPAAAATLLSHDSGCRELLKLQEEPGFKGRIEVTSNLYAGHQMTRDRPLQACLPQIGVISSLLLRGGRQRALSDNAAAILVLPQIFKQPSSPAAQSKVLLSDRRLPSSVKIVAVSARLASRIAA